MWRCAKVVFPDRVGQRTTEQIADIPALQVVEEPVISPDRVQQCFVEANIDTAVGKSVGGARPPQFAKYSATTESVFAVSSGEAGSSWSRASSTTGTAGSGRSRKVCC